MVLFGLLFANLNWVQVYKADEYRNQRLQRPGPGRRVRAQARQHQGRRHGRGAAARRPTTTLKFLRTLPAAARRTRTCSATSRSTWPRPASSGWRTTSWPAPATQLDRRPAARTCSPARRPAAATCCSRSRKQAQETAYNAAAQQRGRREEGRGGRHRPEHRRDPGAGLHAELRPEPAGQPRHRRGARRRTTSSTRTRTSPLQNRALAETLPPGSTFKVIVAAAALENGVSHGHRRSRPAPATPPPDTGARRSSNAAAVVCPEHAVTLHERADRVSCNTGFAQLGVRARRGQAQGEGPAVRLRAGAT